MSGQVPRVYMSGSTPVLKNLALSLAQHSKQPKPVPNIILLLKDNLKLNRFLEQGSYVSSTLNAGNVQSHLRKQFMASCEPPKFANGHIAPIENLIISDFTYFDFKNNIKKYSQCLNNDERPSNVLLLNPGLDTVNYYETQWSKQNLNANLFVGTTQPGAFSKAGEFLTVKNKNILAPLTLQISQINKVIELEQENTRADEIQETSSTKEDNSQKEASTAVLSPSFQKKQEDYEETFLQLKAKNPLLDLIDATSKELPQQLIVTRKSYEHFLIEELEKVCISSCVGAMNVIFDENNMCLLKTSNNLEGIWNRMTAEFSHLVARMYPHLSYAFSNERMNNLILKYLNENKNSTLPMQQELNTHKKYNSVHRSSGLLVRMASFIKLPLPTTELIYNMAKSKINLKNL
ncbi:hypothetical protein ACO0RG_002638 [Hanseniaspora osmophila]